jgi:hypothetical protein
MKSAGARLQAKRVATRGTGRGRTLLLFCVATAAVCGVVFWGIQGALTDDSYITLSYAKTLAFHGTWGMVPHHSANTATSPLHVILLAAGTFITRRPVLALGIVFVAAGTTLAWTLGRAARALGLPLASAAFAVALTVLNPFVLAATGLETMLVAAAIGGLLCCMVERRVVAFGVVSGIALLIRPDMIVFVVAFVIVSPELRHRLHALLLAVAVVVVPWFVPRWLFAGSAMPDTFVIKTLQRFGTATFANGPIDYLQWTHSKAAVSFAPVVFGVIAVIAWSVWSVRHNGPDQQWRPAATLVVAAALYYLCFALMQVPPYQWYYCPTIAAVTIALGLTSGAVFASVIERSGSAWAALAFVPIVLLLTSVVFVVAQHEFPWRREPILFGNWAEPGDYQRIAADLKKEVGSDLVTSPGEIGTLAFYCECNIVDYYSDSSFAVPLINQRIERTNSFMNAMLRVNYAWLDRQVTPPVAHYHLIWEPGWDAGNHDVWNVWSERRGFGHFRLTRS